VKEFSPARLILATAAIGVALSSASLFAQTQSPRPAAPPRVEAAELLLPDAPQPQPGGGQSAAPPASPAQSSSAQSSSAQTSPSQAGAPAATAPTAPHTGAADPTEDKQQEHTEAERELKAEEKQRLLGVMPQFQVVMGGKAAPLSGGQKWRLALHSAIDPFYIGWALVIGGGYGELVGSHNGYGWGPDGYIKRVGANYADNVNGALIGNALLPQLLHQDPRYFRKGTGSIKGRFLYAALSTVVCRGDNGKKQANVSNVLGNYISGGISNFYYPQNERGIGLALENGTSVTLFGALGGQLLEFGPDLARLLSKKRHKVPAAAGASPAAAPVQTPAPAQPPAPASP
jgi:hypothetical protein